MVVEKSLELNFVIIFGLCVDESRVIQVLLMSGWFDIDRHAFVISPVILI